MVSFSEAASHSCAKPQAANRSPTAFLHGVVNRFGSPSLHAMVAYYTEFFGNYRKHFFYGKITNKYLACQYFIQL